MSGGPERPVGVALPGRAVDIVHAAVLRCGLRPGSIGLDFSLSTGALRRIRVVVHRGVAESGGRALFSALGVADPVLGARYGGGPQANLDGDVPALGIRLSVVIDDLPPAPEVSDPSALIAEVDAARAATKDADRGDS